MFISTLPSFMFHKFCIGIVSTFFLLHRARAHVRILIVGRHQKVFLKGGRDHFMGYFFIAFLCGYFFSIMLFRKKKKYFQKFLYFYDKNIECFGFPRIGTQARAYGAYPLTWVLHLFHMHKYLQSSRSKLGFQLFFPALLDVAHSAILQHEFHTYFFQVRFRAFSYLPHTVG